MEFCWFELFSRNPSTPSLTAGTAPINRATSRTRCTTLSVEPSKRPSILLKAGSMKYRPTPSKVCLLFPDDSRYFLFYHLYYFVILSFFSRVMGKSICFLPLLSLYFFICDEIMFRSGFLCVCVCVCLFPLTILRQSGLTSVGLWLHCLFVFFSFTFLLFRK